MRRAPSGDRWRSDLWCWVLGLMAFSAVSGALAHAVDQSVVWRPALWSALFLGLLCMLALVLVGAVLDVWGRVRAQRSMPWLFGAVVVLFGAVELLPAPLPFVRGCATVTMAGAIASYAYLAVTDRLKGAGAIVAALLLGVVAAAVQTSDVAIHLLFPLDHNALSHLVQMAGIWALARGVRLGMRAPETEVIVLGGEAEPLESRT